MDSKLEKLKKLRNDHLRIQYGITLYPYQELVSDKIIEALVDNLEITKDATEEQIDELQQKEIAAELSRQSGKTTAVGLTGEFVITFLSELYQRPIAIGIFAPQLDQAKLSYNLIRDGSRKVKEMFNLSQEESKAIREQENARQLVMPNGSSATVAPLNKVSQIEGMSLDLIIIDEAQIAEDEIVQNRVWPMGKTTNAPRIYIGKAGTQKCYFHTLSQNDETVKIYYEDIVKQRRETYEKTGDARHLVYEKSVNEDILEFGDDAPFIQREYFGHWQIGTGQFVTPEELKAMETDRKPTYKYKQAPCFAGIDTAKKPDSTVVTVLRKEDKNYKEVLNWLELQGDNYQDQFDIILDFLSNYDIQAIAIDSTGQGDFMPDMFENNTQWQDEHTGLFRIKFSAVNKDLMYKNLRVSIQELLTTLPSLDNKYGRKFKQQMLDLQQEHKGQLLSVGHPDHPEAHDDYCDSFALAEWAYAKHNEDAVDIVTVDIANETTAPQDWTDPDW